MAIYDKIATKGLMKAKSVAGDLTDLKKQTRIDKIKNEKLQNELKDLAYYADLTNKVKSMRQKQYDDIIGSDFYKSRQFETPSFDDVYKKDAPFILGGIEYSMGDMKSMIQAQSMFDENSLFNPVSGIIKEGDD